MEIKLSGLEGATDLVPGMKGKVNLITFAQEKALTIPVSALVAKNDGSFIVKVKEPGEGGQTIERAVEVGPESQGQIIVTSGLVAGEMVITSESEPKK